MGIKFSGFVLFVKDISISRRFYEEFLQQKVDVDYGVNVGYKSGLAIWQIDSAYGVVFNNIYNKEKAIAFRNELELYFETDDLDNIYKNLSDNNIEFVHGIIEQPWGSRAFRAYDPDRNIVEIAEPMDAVTMRLFKNGMTLEEVAEKTGTPIDTVKKIVEGC